MKGFKEKVSEELTRSQNFKNVVKKIQEAKGSRVLIISHDDPDGLTSANILEEITKAIGAKEVIKEFPSTFVLEEGQAKELANKYSPDIVLMPDKGTFKFYDNYLKYFKDFVVIDHHFTDSFPEEATYFNPTMEGQPYCSASYITNMIAQALEVRNEYTDLLALIGMKGDFVIEPITGVVSEYVKEFYEEVKQEFPNLFVALSDVTMFDVEQQEKTALLSKFTEAIHGVCGGGFQYFYHHLSDKTRDIFPPAFTAAALASLKNNLACFKKGETIDDLIQCMAEAEKVKLLYSFFKQDWNRVMNFLEASVYVASFEDTALYIFTGNNIPLLPMINSIKIYELIKRDGFSRGILISINKTEEGVHFSLRGTSDRVHCGKIGNNLAVKIKELYGDNIRVTGGGHPKAAECKLMTDEVSYLNALDAFIELINEMQSAADKKDKEKAGVLGLEYLVG